MNNFLKGFRIATIQKFLLIVLIVVFCTGCFLTENATQLANQLGSASEELKSQKEGSEIVIHYETKDGNSIFISSIYTIHLQFRSN